MNDYQDNFADGLSTPTHREQPRPGWFKRNWLWFIPTLILLPVFCCCGGGGALIWFGMGKIFDIAPYKDSIALIEQDSDVQNALGTPIASPKGFTDLVTMLQNGGQFDFKQTNNQMQFDAEIPVSGPNGTGKLVIVAESADGITWSYTTQEVHIDATGEVIDLLNRTSTPEDASDTAEATIQAAIEKAKQDATNALPNRP